MPVNYKTHSAIMMIAGAILLVISGVLFFPAPTANAQCGSQTSSCKNCHEVQGEMPVNNDGSQWHQPHAFGDFCEFCHAGNVQSTDKTEAHTGMVAPLSDLQASCGLCHVEDLSERAQVYATALGVEIGSGSGDGSSGSSESQSGSSTDAVSQVQPTAFTASNTELVIDDPNTVDYVQRYEEIVLGKHQTNWGNIILMALIGMVTVGGGGFVLYREGWVQFTTEPLSPVAGEMPTDLVEMLPDLKNLTPKGRQGLRNLIEDPEAANELLDVIARHTKKGE